jgi:hypothetical protein
MDQYRLKRASKFDKNGANTFLYFRLPIQKKPEQAQDSTESLPSETSLSSEEQDLSISIQDLKQDQESIYFEFEINFVDKHRMMISTKDVTNIVSN